MLKSKSTVNVHGEIFDSKLQWNDHVAHAIKKAYSALHCIKTNKILFQDSKDKTN